MLDDGDAQPRAPCAVQPATTADGHQPRGSSLLPSPQGTRQVTQETHEGRGQLWREIVTEAKRALATSTGCRADQRDPTEKGKQPAVRTGKPPLHSQRS